MRKQIWVACVVVLIIGGIRATPAQAKQCFTGVPDINDCIDGRFQQFWNENGGLPVFGYPITDQHDEANLELNRLFPSQWFERNRFELHTENAAPYDVLLGLLGTELLKDQSRDPANEPNNGNPLGGTCQHFGATDRDVCGPFLEYWRTHGLQTRLLDPYRRSLALFGYPLTGVKLETNQAGKTVLTQWFERARFEWYPNNPDPYKVQLGLLGREMIFPPIIQPQT